jgi:hypothetical protein
MSVRKKQPAKRASKATAKSAAGARKRGTGKKATAKPAKAKRSKSAPKASKKPKARPAAKKPGSDKKLKAKQAAQARLKEKAAAQKQKERERAEKERDKARVAKEREREQKEQQRAREQEKRDKAREKAQREKEREALRREKLKQQEEKRRAREKELKDREKKRELERREAEKARLKKEADAQREAERAAKEAERLQRIAERDAEREAQRKAKEDERERRDAEREAYRKAKEAERERLRAEREAAKRLREGKVARATKAAQRVDGLRVGSTRVYDPAAIPNQSGTSRRLGELGPQRLVGVRIPELGKSGDPPSVQPESASVSDRPKQPTPPPPPVTESIEQRHIRILERLAQAGEAMRKEYEETLEMSWIHHDSALEGVVYTFQELKTAVDPTLTVVPDSSMQPVCEEIRRHRQAIAYTRDLGERKRVPLNVDVVKKLFVILHPEEGDVKSVKYRKDIPQHRLYFHEYAAPDKIAYRVRQVMDWLNGPEAKKMKNPVRVAARVHYDLLRVFPFAQDSGKVCRLLMNVILMRGGYPPAIIHSTERQRYYEALKGQLPVIISLVNESILNGLASIEKRLDDHEAK